MTDLGLTGLTWRQTQSSKKGKFGEHLGIFKCTWAFSTALGHFQLPTHSDMAVLSISHGQLELDFRAKLARMTERQQVQALMRATKPLTAGKRWDLRR
jgi:hypothetical protein